MTHDRLKQIDEALFYIVKNDLCDFTIDDGAIVRVGDWGYIKAVDYEPLFKSEREQLEYQAINNETGGQYTFEIIDWVSAMSDDELNDLLNELNDEPDCSIYYTESE